MRVVATAGHVDHGKSTLLRALTGMEPDRWREEQDRGLTIDLGFVWTTLTDDQGELTIAFVDVPGHERFVPNMLAGAGAAPTTLFVVAADDGWSAQSQEHLDILGLFDIGIAAVAVTKVAVVGAARAREVARDVGRRLGDADLEAPVVVVDGVRGDGLDDLRTALLARLRAMAPPADTGRARLWIDRVFSVGGAGTVVTGTLGGGRFATGSTVEVAPSGERARIRRLETLRTDVERVGPGARVAVNLAGSLRQPVARGDALVSPGAYRTTGELDAWLRALPGHALRRRGAWRLHAGSAAVDVELAPVLGGAIYEDGGYARLVLRGSLPLTAGDRLVVRDLGRAAVAGGGEALDVEPPPRPRGADARLERAEELETLRLAADRLGALVAVAGARRRDDVVAAAGVATDGMPGDGLVQAGEWLVDVEAMTRWRDAAVAVADVGGGVERREIVDAVVRAGAPGSFAQVLPDHLADTGALQRVRASYTTPARASALTAELARRAERLLTALRAEPLAPPPLDRLTVDAGVDAGDLQQLVQEERIVLTGDLAFAADAVAEAVARLQRLEADHGPFTASQAREAWGTTRRYAIPLLEHLDRVGVTVFDGSTRTLRSRRFAGDG